MTDPTAEIMASQEARLISERDAALSLVKAKPTGANRKAYKSACTALEEFLKAKLEPEGEQSFASILEVVEYLDGEGWKVSRSSAYDHWKKDGRIKPSPDGSFSISAVHEYARLYLQKKDGTPGAAGGFNLQEEKIHEEIRRIRHDADMRELNYRLKAGELMPKEYVEAELAERAANLKTYFDSVARSAAGRMIKIVGGDQQKAPDLIAFLLGMNRKAMDNYSRPILGLEDEEE